MNCRAVNFLIAGTQKGGTTALHSYLRDHPELCLSRVKETHFFDTEAHFQTRRIDYGPFHAHFRPSLGQLLGEATPITMYWPDAPRRVWQYNPAMKLICILRNPIERAFSHWNMEYQRGAEVLSFMDALERESERCRASAPLPHRVYSYIDRGFYCEQIRRLWRFFDPCQCLFVKTEELRYRPQETVDRVFDFLGVARRRVESRIVHARQYSTLMSPPHRQFLLDIYEREIRELSHILKWDCRDWLNPWDTASADDTVGVDCDRSPDSSYA